MNEEIEAYHPENDLPDDKMKKINNSKIKLEADEIVYDRQEKEDRKRRGAYGEAKEIVLDKLDKHNKLIENEKNKRRSVRSEKVLAVSKVVTNEDLLKDKKYKNKINDLGKFRSDNINKN